MQTIAQTVSDTAPKSHHATNYARAKEAAQHLRIARSTLWQWVKERKNEGFPQPVKVGLKVTLFDLNAIDAFVDAQNKKEGVK